MAQYFQAFVALSLLTHLIPLLTLASIQERGNVDKSSEWCMNHDTDCEKYLNVRSVCEAGATSGNYTFDPLVKEKNFLTCVCLNDQYLPGLKACEKCTGGCDYPSAEAQCDALMEEQTPRNNPASTMTMVVEQQARSDPTHYPHRHHIRSVRSRWDNCCCCYTGCSHEN